MEAKGGHPILLRHFIFYFTVSNSTLIILLYLKREIPIIDPIDEFNFLFIIPYLARVTFLGFLCYLVKRGARVPRAVS